VIKSKTIIDDNVQNFKNVFLFSVITKNTVPYVKKIIGDVYDLVSQSGKNHSNYAKIIHVDIIDNNLDVSGEIKVFTVKIQVMPVLSIPPHELPNEEESP
jgi:hypothetical protein